MSTEFWLWLAFGAITLIYIFVGKLLVSRDQWDTPKLLWNPTVRLVAVALPFLGFAALVVAGFAWTDKGWWLLVGSVVATVIFSVRPKI